MIRLEARSCKEKYCPLYFVVLFIIICNVQLVYIECSKYRDDWDSLDKRPLPKWYDEAKIGIFIHWGVYSVPSIGTEWFWKNWRGIIYNLPCNFLLPPLKSNYYYFEGVKSPVYVSFMNKNYKEDFTYQQFASQFTAELFNATEWALMLKESGAKYGRVL